MSGNTIPHAFAAVTSCGQEVEPSCGGSVALWFIITVTHPSTHWLYLPGHLRHFTFEPSDKVTAGEKHVQHYLRDERLISIYVKRTSKMNTKKISQCFKNRQRPFIKDIQMANKHMKQTISLPSRDIHTSASAYEIGKNLKMMIMSYLGKSLGNWQAQTLLTGEETRTILWWTIWQELPKF